MTPDNKSNWRPSSARWCIYIDVLGFSKLWETDPRKAIKPLNRLMRDIFRIGKRCYPETSERLFVHQTGDGFAIVGDFGEVACLRSKLLDPCLLDSIR